MKQEFYSNGKLLLTGEYVVLDGAKALALPTQKGQSLTIETNNSGILLWESFDCHNQNWYTTSIKISELLKKQAPKGNSKFDETLFKILWHAQQLNSNFLNTKNGYTIHTHLTFERLWGLGTSSTLINNIAQWATINAFKLLQLSFGGSGYDIACAQNNTPIFYTRTPNTGKPLVSNINFNPVFTDRIFFIYLNEKKDSKEAISVYQKLNTSQLETVISKINKITEAIYKCTNFEAFEALVTEHEETLSNLLNVPTVKQTRFPDYKGAVKSLGGWGGDFVLATGSNSNMVYFKNKGYTTIVSYAEMILEY